MAAEDGDVAGKAVTVRDVSAADFIKAYSEHLQNDGRIKLPKWVDYVKTGTHKELPPMEENWYYIRLAAVARKMYLMNGIGMGSLRRMFGGGKRRGVCPLHFQKASGSVLRHCLHSLEECGILERDDSRGGRRKLTRVGQQSLDQIASKVVQEA